MNRTPTPWTVEPVNTLLCEHGDGSFHRDYPGYRIRASDAQCPQGIASIYNRHSTAKANAAFIVRAVNSHDDLVEALRLLTSAIDLSKLNVKKDFHLLNVHANATRLLHKLNP